jgi:hypothetical protein
MLKRHKLEILQSKITGRIDLEVKFRICILEMPVSNLRQATEAFVVSIELSMLNLLEQIEIVHDCLLLNNL